MRRAIHVLSLGALTASVTFFGWRSYSRRVEIPTVAPAAFAVGAQKDVRFRFDAESLQGLSDDTIEDQLLDWLLYAVVADSTADANALRGAMHDLPPTRAEYVQPVASFDFGPVRFRVIDQAGTAIALIPAQSERRAELIAQVADAVRASLGSAPNQLRLFEYRIDPVEFTANVRRAPDVPGDELFTPAFGYVSNDVGTAEQFDAFMKSTGDLVSVQRISGGVRLGGRRVKDPARRSLRLEDVAALWHSENVLASDRRRLDDFDASWKDNARQNAIAQEIYARERAALIAQYPELNTQVRQTFQIPRSSNSIDDLLRNYPQPDAADGEMEKLFRSLQAPGASDGVDELLRLYRLRAPRATDPFDTGLTGKMGAERALAAFKAKWDDRKYSYVKKVLQARHDQEYEELIKTFKVKGGVRPPDGSGFSLDPSYNYTSLRRLFAQYRPLFSTVATEDRLDAVDRDLGNRQEGKFLELLYEMSQQKGKEFLVDLIQEDLLENAGFQHARYDGTLEGTEVGMVLFYTDLLAKLWALDYQQSAPDKRDSTQWVPGFVPLLKVATSPIYRQEISELSSTRLWFGPRDNAFSKTAEGLLFAPIATRVYAASSNMLQPGKEAEPNAESAMFLGWWNDHYAQVADYEPEYHRLNEIMKWSTALAWFSAANDLSALEFLGDTRVAVKRDNRFPEWARAQKSLRYRAWDPVKFFPRGYEGVETESMPRLYSRDRALSGGVSLASRTELAARPQLHADLDPIVRRANASSIEQRAEGLVVHSFDKTSYTLPRGTGPGPATVEAKATTKLRGHDLEIKSGAFNLEFEQNASRVRTSIGVNGRSIGELRIDRRGDGSLDVMFRPLEVEHARAYSKTLNRAPANPGDRLRALAARPDIRTVIQTGEAGNVFFIEPADQTGRWLKILPEGAPRKDLAADADFRFASLAADSGVRGDRWNVVVIDPQKLETELATSGRYLSTLPSDAPQSGVGFSISPRGPPAGSTATPIDIQSLPPSRRNVLAAIDDSRKTNGGGGSGDGGSRGNSPGSGAGDFGGDGGRRRLIREATADPDKAVLLLGETRKKGIGRAEALLREGRFEEARLELDKLGSVITQDAEIQSYRVVAHAATNSPVAAAEAARLVLSAEQLPAFLDAVDLALPKLVQGSPAHRELNAIVRGVVARTRGVDAHYIKTRGELGIEIRLAGVGWDSSAPAQEAAAAARYSAETIDSPVAVPSTPIPPASMPITGKLRDATLALTQPDVIVDTKTGARYRKATATRAESQELSVSWARAHYHTGPNNCASLTPEQRASRSDCNDDVYLTAAAADAQRR